MAEKIISRPATDEYRSGWEWAFGEQMPVRDQESIAELIEHDKQENGE